MYRVNSSTTPPLSLDLDLLPQLPALQDLSFLLAIIMQPQLPLFTLIVYLLFLDLLKLLPSTTLEDNNKNSKI